ncbi:MAG: hypothetical protein LQ337_004156 [Flavoplaca oasis]|nr:MAG: hypothetical protein LQ337_004156 [Flavoplaca oasis]
MTVGYVDELNIPSIPFPMEYVELFCFSVAKDLVQHGINYTIEDLRLILLDINEEKNRHLRIIDIETIKEWMDTIDNRQGPEYLNYLELYKFTITDPKLFDSLYREKVNRQQLNIANEALYGTEVELIAWSKYWTNDVSDSQIMDVICFHRRAGQRPDFPPRTDHVDRELPALVCRSRKAGYLPQFRAAAQPRVTNDRLCNDRSRKFDRLYRTLLSRSRLSKKPNLISHFLLD